MSVFKKDEVVIKDEFDFYVNPLVKGVLRELRQKLNKLPEDQKSYELDNYAVQRKLRLNPKINIDDGQRKPDGGQVVLPGYSRLLNAYKWLKKLEEAEGTIVQEHVQALQGIKGTPADLPF